MRVFAAPPGVSTLNFIHDLRNKKYKRKVSQFSVIERKQKHFAQGVTWNWSRFSSRSEDKCVSWTYLVTSGTLRVNSEWRSWWKTWRSLEFVIERALGRFPCTLSVLYPGAEDQPIQCSGLWPHHRIKIGKNQILILWAKPPNLVRGLWCMVLL